MTKAVIVKEHRSNYPNPIAFSKGEKLELGNMDTEYEGWRRVKTLCGNEGWAPAAYVSALGGGSSGIAMHDYSAAELDVDTGEHVDVKRELCDWCWVVNVNGEEGWVPRKSLELV